MKQLIAWTHPALFAAGYVFLSFANLPTPASGLWRPLFIVVVGAMLLSLVLGVATRNRALGALLASATIVALSAAWLLVAVAAVVLTWVAAVGFLRRRQGRRPLRWQGTAVANRLVGVFGGMFAVVTALSAAPAALQSAQYQVPVPPRVTITEPAPSIFMLLLDGYPRSDVLSEYLGHDNADFEAALTDMGFNVAPASRANYSATWATLASMFHSTYLHEIDTLAPFPTDQTEQYARLMEAMNEGTVLGDLRSHGYRLVTAPSPFESVTLTSADSVLNGGQLTFFELSLLQHSRLLGGILAIAPDFVLGQQRDRITDALQATIDVAGAARGEPTFMLTHLMSPHPPITFDERGRLAELPDCFPATCTLWAMNDARDWQGMPQQVRHLNELVTNTVRSIVAVDPGAIIIVMSDHGMRPPGAPQDVLLDNLLAVRSPGRPSLIAPDTHLVNLLPSILNTYLGTPSSPREYRGWVSLTERPLDMIEVTLEP